MYLGSRDTNPNTTRPVIITSVKCLFLFTRCQIQTPCARINQITVVTRIYSEMRLEKEQFRANERTKMVTYNETNVAKAENRL